MLLLKRPGLVEQVAAAARQAEVHLRAYLDTFGNSKQLPDTCAPAYMGWGVGACCMH